ncbi:MAG TPA: helix-turn-helix domain-containing protein [Isosphaeraceae bacterium]
MAQFYTLEEAARVLGMGPEELKAKAQHREIRAFMDSGSWRFRVADVDELARRRGLGSDPDFSLSDPELSLSKLDLESPAPISESEELNLSEFQLGTAKPDLGQPTMDIAAHGSDPEKDVVVDDLSLPGATSSSSTILGMKSGGKLPSDSDVRLAPHVGPKAPSDSDVTLVSDDQSVLDFPTAKAGDTAVRQSPMVGSSAEVAAGPKPPGDSDSDFELTPSSVIDALQPESGSDFELSAIDASDEFDSTPLRGPSDSDVTASTPADSGINLGRPSDSGINLGGIEGMNLSADSIELAPLSGSNIKASPKPAAKAKPSDTVKPGSKSPLSATPPPRVGKGEKDIFEDTDFEVDALGSDESDDRTMQIEATSDFDLDESDSASEVFAIDEEDVDESAATAMGPAVLDEEDSGEFGADEDSGIASSGWDVDSEPVAAVSPVATSGGTMISARGESAEWGGLWVGFLGVGTILTLLAAFVSIDLMRNLYDYHGNGPASGIINTLAGLFPK